MKEHLNLFAEVLAIPFSESFMREDALAGCIDALRGSPCNKDTLSKKISNLAPVVAAGLNTHININYLSELQGFINYIFDAEQVLRDAGKISKPSGRDLAQRFYISLVRRTAKTFLTVRQGKIAFKYWPGAQEAYSNGPLQHSRNYPEADSYDLLGNEFTTQRIEVWHSVRQCLPEDMLISMYAAILVGGDSVSGRREKMSACLSYLIHFGDTVSLSDLLLDDVLEKGLAETHLHAGASRAFGEAWEVMLGNYLNGRETISQAHALAYKSIWQEGHNRDMIAQAVVLQVLLSEFLTSGYEDLTSYLAAESDGYGTVVQRLLADIHQKGYGDTSAIQGSRTVMKELLKRFSGQSSDEPMGIILRIPQEILLVDKTISDRLLMAAGFSHLADKPEDTAFLATFIYYLRIRCGVYRRTTQDSKNKGLQYFAPYYDSSTDAGAQDNETRMMVLIKSALRDARIVKTELRRAVKPPKSENMELAVVEVKASII